TQIYPLSLPDALPIFDRRHRPAELVHPLDQLPGARLELLSQRLDEIRAAERIGRVRSAGLVREQLLRAERDVGAPFGGQCQRFRSEEHTSELQSRSDL